MDVGRLPNVEEDDKTPSNNASTSQIRDRIVKNLKEEQKSSTQRQPSNSVRNSMEKVFGRFLLIR